MMSERTAANLPTAVVVLDAMTGVAAAAGRHSVSVTDADSQSTDRPYGGERVP
jgi:hypothetical protein